MKHVAIVVPARDEERTLGSCLASLDLAVAHLHRAHPGIAVIKRVVLDCCSDGTPAVARQLGWATCTSTYGIVGAARRVGCAEVLDSVAAAGGAAVESWLASTDADTVVPPHWLTTQVGFALNGADVVLGTVQPDDDLPPAERSEWHRRHLLGEGHPYVHGANLGVRASSYARAGGFTDLAYNEDVDLVARLRALPGARVVATDRIRVVTSGRMSGRAPGGFARYVSDLSTAQ